MIVYLNFLFSLIYFKNCDSKKQIFFWKTTLLCTYFFPVAGLDQSNCKVHYAHRSVLAAASAYFNAMFTSDVLEAKRERIGKSQVLEFKP